jgi:hypothetical protein
MLKKHMIVLVLVMLGAMAGHYLLMAAGSDEIGRSVESNLQSSDGTILRTCEAPVPIPFIAGFEGVPNYGMPECWTRVGVTAYWDADNVGPRSGTRAAHIYGLYFSPLDAWMITPKLFLNAGDYRVDYWYRGSSSTAEQLEVRMGTSPDTTTFSTIVDPLFTVTQGPYRLKSLLVTISVADTYYFGWHARIVEDNEDELFVDDLSIYPAGTCRPPDSLKVPAARGDNQVTLAASLIGGYGYPDGYQWYHGVGVTNPDSLIAGANGATYTTTFSGIFSCKGWWANAASCSAWDSARAVVIQCPDPNLFPLVEGFESGGGSTLPLCWSQQQADPYSPTWMISSYAPHSGNMHAMSGWDPYDATNCWLFSSGIQMTAGHRYALTFYYRSRYENSESMGVKMGGGRDLDSMTTTLVPYFSFSTTDYSLDSVAFTASSTGIRYIGWHAVSPRDGNGFLLDDVRLYSIGPVIVPCDSAIGLTITIASESPDQIQLNYTAPDSGSYVIYSSTVRNNDGDPRFGDLQWTMEATVTATAAGPCAWTDPAPAGEYKNYVVVHLCGSFVGR